MQDSRSFIDDLIFGKGSSRRYMQSSPILYDVWSAFAQNPWARIDLLLTPYRGTRPGMLCNIVRMALDLDRNSQANSNKDQPSPSTDHVAYNQSDVAACLDFPDLVRVVLPMTGWWQKRIHEKLKDQKTQKAGADVIAKLLTSQKKRLVTAICDFRDGNLKKSTDLTPDVVWLLHMIGSLAILRQKTKPGDKPKPPSAYYDGGAVVTAAKKLMVNLAAYGQVIEAHAPAVHVVNRNRLATTSIDRSTRAIKSDAALRLFEIDCSRLKWAVIDSGVDARHKAFMVKDATGDWAKDTRVRETYDFSFIRHLLSPSQLHAENEFLPERLPQALAVSQNAKRASQEKKKKSASDTKNPKAGNKTAGKMQKKVEATEITASSASAKSEVAAFLSPAPNLHDEFLELKRALLKGRDVDWGLLRPFLKVPYDKNYQPPANDHGTHVGGILAAGGEDAYKKGVCPDINLIDIRVLDEKGEGNEFNVIAALQFIRYLNGTEDHMIVHGANLSLSIDHDVANYACGRTPVCDEADRLVDSGVCVVTAAGNKGYIKYHTAEGPREGYHTISITDPGNADKVITVGATHRYRPHTYGVSYFSSRGPTGDGRLKPDLVAPGEKIEAPTPDDEWRTKDGTSMAAPHVSGAAALLMARHREMVGRPVKIKRILCETATDLGRERYFQGHGMLDILRALQSV